jgi:hypothetical protein
MDLGGVRVASPGDFGRVGGIILVDSYNVLIFGLM